MSKNKLTQEQAKKLCKVIFGTSSGLETMDKARGYRITAGAIWGLLYLQEDGKVWVQIGADAADRYIDVIYDPIDLKPDYDATIEMHRNDKEEMLKEWVLSCGEDRCCERIHKIWEKRWQP